MNLVVANAGYACSTLMLGSLNFPFSQGFTKKMVEHEFVRCCRALANAHRFKSKVALERLGEYYAHVIVSTVPSQTFVVQILQDLGFKNLGECPNEKNGTMCTLWHMTAAEFAKKIAELEQTLKG